MATRKSPIILFDPKAKTEKFKRPDHVDFMTNEELKKIKMTGIRQNRALQQWEFWILGKIEKTVSFLAVSIDPKALVDAHVELFHMKPDPGLFENVQKGKKK